MNYSKGCEEQMRIISQSSGRGTGQRGLATAGVAPIKLSCRF